MSYTNLPTRIDQEIVAGTDVGFEFVIIGDGGVLNIANDTIQMIISDGYGGTPVLMKSNSVGQHSDPAKGKTQFLYTRTETWTGLRAVARWWYEIRRIEAVTLKQRVHIQGEFNALPSLVV